ncbi:unnamed protein product [Withania somnifera]
MFKPGGPDIESGHKGGVGVSNNQIYPGMTEDPQMRWAFIRKVYAIVCTQLLFTAVIAACMFFTQGVKDYMRTVWGTVALAVLLVISFILILLMGRYGRKHPWNYVLMGMFTLCLACVVGAACSIEKGADFTFLGPFLFCASIVLCMFLLMQFILHLGREARVLYSCLAALLFSAFLIYDTNNLIRNFSYDEYVIAAICLFGDIVNLLLALLGLSGD